MKEKIHIIGVCGTGMGGLAVLFKRNGFEITGSDSVFYPPMSEQLLRFNIKYQGFSSENVRDSDIVIVGNAVSKNNPEVQESLALNKKIMSLPEALNNFFIKDKRLIVVTGTHGKTTTSSMISWILSFAGKKPSFLVGGIPVNFEVSAFSDDGDFFVLEGDEYDTAYFDKRPKIFHFFPERAIIGSIEYDHADIYPDFKTYSNTFERFSSQIKYLGCFYENPETLRIMNLMKNEIKKVTFGLNTGDFRVDKEDIKYYENGISFHIHYNGKKENIYIPIFGHHNALNAAAAFSVLHDIVQPPTFSIAMEKFKGVRRRLEILIRDTEKNIVVIDDFAHHPTEVRAGIEAVKKHRRGRVIAVFEPRSHTARRRVYQQDYKKVFSLADSVFIYRIYKAETVKDEERLNPKEIVEYVKSKGKDAFYVESELSEKILDYIKPGDTVIFMSSGDFDREIQKFKNLYESVKVKLF